MRTKFPIHELVREAHVAYAVVPRRSAFSAEDDTSNMNVLGRNWAKVVVCFLDGEPIEAVVPLAMTVNLDCLRELAKGHDIRLAQDEELERLFPQGEPEKAPASNTERRLSIFVDVALAAETEILFNTDVPDETIRIRWPDFATTLRPIVGKFAEPQLDRVGGFRLSYRE